MPFALDILQIYLLAMNAAALVVGLVDARARQRGGRGISSRVSIAFSLLGGAGGIFVTSLATSGSTRKENVAQRFFAVWAIGAWALVLANIYGPARFDLEQLKVSLLRDHLPLWIYLGLVNALTFILFCADKLRAKRGDWRIPEGVLLGASLVGGSLGGLLGMAVAHHKVRTDYFRAGLPLALVLDVAVIAYLMQLGIV